MLLSNYPLIRASSFDETEDIGRTFFRYRRTDLLAPCEKYHYLINASFVGTAMIAYTEYNAKLHFNVGEHDAYYAAFRGTGHDEYCVGNRQFSIGTQQFGVLPPRIPVHVTTTGDASALVVRLDPQVLESEVAQQLDHDKQTSIEFGNAVRYDQGPIQSLYRYVLYVAEEINRPDSLFHRSPVAMAHAAKTMSILLLEGHPSNATLQLINGTRPGSDQQIRRVEEYVRSHLSLPITMGDLAAIAGVSASTLHDLFRRRRGCAPMQFVRRLRLEAVRRDLQSGQPRSTVTEVAYRWGFIHLGRFAEHYRRAFGESPSTTFRRHRP